MSPHTSLPAFLLLALGCYVLLVLSVAVLPAALIGRQVPPDGRGIAEGSLEARGRALYQRYGCVYCHTQQVRGDERLATLDDDLQVHVPVLRPDRRFGLERASVAEDYRNDAPPFMGTQRTGPDLTNVGSRMPSADWHYWHFYAPRVVSPDSNMPGLPWMFVSGAGHVEGEGVPVMPLKALEAAPYGVPGGRLWATRDAQALVAYVLSLRRKDGGR